VQRAVESGLPADQAVRALTLHPAEILGVADRLGTIEVGKNRQPTLVRGAVTDRGARVAQLFVDGRPVAVRAPPRRARARSRPGPARQAPAGAWTTPVSLDNANHACRSRCARRASAVTGTVRATSGPRRHRLRRRRRPRSASPSP
jgi:adenine deaminase